MSRNTSVNKNINTSVYTIIHKNTQLYISETYIYTHHQKHTHLHTHQKHHFIYLFTLFISRVIPQYFILYHPQQIIHLLSLPQ